MYAENPAVEFPEHLFQFERGSEQTYQRLVDTGKQRMSALRVVICGLTRNTANIIHLTAKRIERLGGMFRDYRIEIFENDSADATRLALEGWATKNNRVNILGDDRGDPVNPQARCLKRTARMAIYRNALRQGVLRHGSWASHAIVVDTDLPGGWSYNGVAHTFGHEMWDFVGSNGIKFVDYAGEESKPVYFDVWAFRWQGSDDACKPTDINPRQWLKGAALLPVNSCFGGLGCYRMDAFRRCAYDGTDCEHVPFHRKMRDNGMGRLFMNPAQLTLY